MKYLLVIVLAVFCLTGCGGGDEDVVKFNSDLATFMQKDLERNGVSGDIETKCRPDGDTYTCDIFATFSDGKRQRLGDANHVRRTTTGFTWDRES